MYDLTNRLSSTPYIYVLDECVLMFDVSTKSASKTLLSDLP
jgi:ABC-type oligopeptide transport system ATPase subunit